MLAAMALFLFVAQTDRLATIEGKVLDAVTNQPLAGARIIMLRTDRGGAVIGARLWDTVADPGGYEPNADTIAVLTGIDGVFQFRVAAPVKFMLFADLGEYVRFSGRARYEADAKGTSGIVIRLTPEQTISGRITDVDTDKPVRGMAVVPCRYLSATSGRLLVPAGRSGTTDAEGRYRLEGLTPGEYYLEIRPPYGEKIGEPALVKDFRDAVQITYARSWYPGVSRREEAVPVTVPAGSTAEGIDIRIAKRRTASVRGRVILAEGALTEGETVLLTLMSVEKTFTASMFASTASGKVRPGAGFQIDRLSPGTYWLMAHTQGRSRAERLWAGINLQVGEENLDGMDLHMRKGVTVTGRIRIEGPRATPNGPALPKNDMQANLAPLVRAPMFDESNVPVRSEDGSFSIPGVIADTYRVVISNALTGYKISGVRYNGTRCAQDLVSIDATANAHELDITLAAANASIAVTATDGSRPVPGATVLMLPDGADGRFFAVALKSVQADKDGRASFDGLLPGVYRLAAYPEGTVWGEDPNLRQRIAGGEEVRLTAGQVALKQIRTVSASDLRTAISEDRN